MAYDDEEMNMSLQAVFDRQALAYLPVSAAYANSFDEVRAGHHRHVILREISNAYKPVAEMTQDELLQFDLACLNRLLRLDESCIVVLNIIVINDDVSAEEHYPAGCNYTDGYRIEGFQVDFAVRAMNNDMEESEFNISFQSRDTSCAGLEAVGRFEMTTSAKYGNDGDESPELRKFLEENEAGYERAISVLYEIAYEVCKRYAIANFPDEFRDYV